MIDELIIRKHFSDYMIRRMTELEIRPWYVAYYSETCENTFRQYLKGLRLPPPITLILMAELFDCSVNDLLGYESYYTAPRHRLFDSGLDADSVAVYFKEQMMIFMEYKDMSLDDLASCIRVDVMRLHNHMKRHTLPDTATILHICDALDCTPSELLGY